VGNEVGEAMEVGRGVGVAAEAGVGAVVGVATGIAVGSAVGVGRGVAVAVDLAVPGEVAVGGRVGVRVRLGIAVDVGFGDDDARSVGVPSGVSATVGTAEVSPVPGVRALVATVVLSGEVAVPVQAIATVESTVSSRKSSPPEVRILGNECPLLARDGNVLQNMNTHGSNKVPLDVRLYQHI